MFQKLPNILPVIRTFFKTALDKIFGEKRYAFRKLKLLLFEVYYLNGGLILIFTYERRLTSQHFINCASYGPNIGKSFIAFIEYYLGCHPASRTCERLHTILMKFLCTSEIRKFNYPWIRNKNICPFYISMKNTIKMKILKSFK